MDDGGIPDGVPAAIGSLGGFSVSANVRRRMSEEPILTVTLDDVPGSELRLPAGQIGEAALVTRLENRLTGVERLRDETGINIDRLRAEVARAGDLLGTPFPHAEKLAAARARVSEIGEELRKIVNRTADHEPARETAPPPVTRQDQRLEWARRAPAAAPAATVPLGGGRPAGALAP